MKTKYHFLVLSSIFVLLNSCLNKNSNIEYSTNGKLKTIIITPPNSNHRIEYNFFENGKLKSVHKYIDKLYDGEQLWFFSDGNLDRKIQFNNGKANGKAYYFYDSSGSLIHSRYFRDNREVLYGADYWDNDSLNIMKSSLHFNDSGQIYYKKNFDKDGKFLSEEGNRE